jgi:TonB family protein
VDKRRETRFRTALDFLEALQHAWPDAFGPRADEAVSAYVKDLTRDRSAERRARLRLAEELSEKSGPRDSMRSMAAVVSPSVPPPRRAPQRLARIGVVALCLGVGSAAAAVPAYLKLLPAPKPVPLAVSPAATQLGELPREAASTPTLGPVPDPAPPDASAEPLDTVTPAADRSLRVALASAAARSTEPRVAGNGAPIEPPSIDTNVEPAAAEPLADDALEATADVPAYVPRLAPAVATIPAVAALTPSRPVEPEPVVPRIVPSKIGHGLLRIDPNADAYRVRPPGALARAGQAFQATVKICVSESGNVSSVSVLRSAGPAIDPQIREVLSRWRYRPWVQAGQNTPFCYTLAYQIAH